MKKVIFFVFVILFLCFKYSDTRSIINVPRMARSITSGDIDLDGDVDILTGHGYSSQTQWSGISILLNENGNFHLEDSIFLYSAQTSVCLTKLSDNPYPSIIGRHFDNDQSFIAIINWNISGYSIEYYLMESGITGFTTGNINNDQYPDVIVYIGDYDSWGVMYNNGIGGLYEPEYFSTGITYPNGCACSDIDGNGLDDIVLTGIDTEIFFNYPDGFESIYSQTNIGHEDPFILDFDLDGDKDIITYGCFWGYSYLTMYRYVGDTVFETISNFSFQQNTYTYSVCDFNNDSLPDVVFILSDYSGLKIFYNKGDFVLENPQFYEISFGFLGYCFFSCKDYDKNGYNDIAIVNNPGAQQASKLFILFNDGQGNFQEDPLTNINEPFANLDHGNSVNFCCSPNPIRNSTDFSFTISPNSNVDLCIYDIKGRLINQLYRKEFPSNGSSLTSIQKIHWDATSFNGQKCLPGIYLATLTIDGKPLQTIKIIKN